MLHFRPCPNASGENHAFGWDSIDGVDEIVGWGTREGNDRAFLLEKE